MESTIAKSSSRQSKWIYYLLCLEFRIKRYQIHDETNIGKLQKHPEDNSSKIGPNDHESRPASLLWSPIALCRLVHVSKIYTIDLRRF
jgi:hypothetical protein